ncbi:MAG TPA: hypothetical protein VEC38_01180 [Candidatus Binataceae bacterium]|nr:hypothetical protein [Candidatus Binataceae bacterium]
MAKPVSKTNRPRLTLDIRPALRRRIKVAAAAQDLSVSAYVTGVLDRVVPPAQPLKRTARGAITPETLRRLAAFRAEQTTPFPDDSSDLVRESRIERENQL